MKKPLIALAGFLYSVIANELFKFRCLPVKGKAKSVKQ
jgi:hypothetical protein